MKNIYSILLAFTFTFSIFSCSQQNEKDYNKENPEKNDTLVKEENEKEADESPLEGVWVIKRASGDLADMNVGVNYEFKGEHLTLGSGSFKNPGTTTITDSTFSFKADGNDLLFIYRYKLIQDTLIVTMGGSNQTFYMVKN